MLESETKRRIDTARDILVGKVPDPKSQVEQITIALIYKFMDDMDKESKEMGGKASFFTGEFKRYRWSNIFNPRLGGHEMLNLYAEAIVKLNQNPGIPQLFREIFKNAYLPYRDPETLKLFLTTINEFEYDHSENLGDAFEYLLSVLGSQGDAGQFRTPRNIIDFMVEVIDPQKNEIILDPACGTAGFLISSYKHIMKANTKKTPGDLLTTKERKKLMDNFLGYDISPDMVRLSLVNLYLHGFSQPKIFEYDTLTSDERWNEYAGAILTNPPFMSPKGGIKPHKKFSIQSNRSEVIFVDYIAEHLSTSGRAAVIVPEGIIFQSGKAYKQLRKSLVEKYLYAVVSLPSGVFNPYAGVKTSILFLDTLLARKSDSILFVKIENDGFSLGAQRRAIDKNDLPGAVEIIKKFRKELTQRRRGAEEKREEILPRTTRNNTNDINYLVVSKDKIAENGEYNLTGERYREVTVATTTHRLVPLSLLMRDGVKTIDPRITPDEIFELWSIPAFDVGKPELIKGIEIGSQKKLVLPDDVLLSRIVPHIRRAWIVESNNERYRQVASTEWLIFSSNEIYPSYIKYLFISDRFHTAFMQTITGIGGSLSRANPKAVGEIQIPLPPTKVQMEIVTEIEEYQKVIDGAKQVVENWKPHIEIDPDWQMVRLGDAPIEIIDGDRGINYPKKEDFSSEGYCLFLNTSNVRKGYFNFESNQFISEQKDKMLRKGKLKYNDIVLTTRGTVGNIAYYDKDIMYKNIRINSGMVILRVDPKRFDPLFVVQFFLSGSAEEQIRKILSGSAQPQLPIRSLFEFQIPLPPIEVQQKIVAEIETEKKAVDGCRELIALYEGKIKNVIERVWGNDSDEV